MPTIHFIRLLLAVVAFTGCAHDDARLHGTWRSNRDATVAAAFKRDPRWTNAPPEKVERFRDMFGHMTVTYSNNTGWVQYKNETYSFKYRIVRRGADYVVMRDDTELDKGRDIRMRFDNAGASYWIDTGPLGRGLEERFDKLQAQ
jgi:hypothetical protein